MDIRKKRKGILITAMAVVIAGMSMVGFVDVSAAKTGTSATLKDARKQLGFKRFGFERSSC